MIPGFKSRMKDDSRFYK